MNIAARLRHTLIVLATMCLLPARAFSQGILPSQWGYGAITAAKALAYSPDGKLIALAGDGGVQIWKAATNSLVMSIPTEAGEVFGVAFSPDGHTLALGGCVGLYGGGGPVLELWNVTTGRFIRSMNSRTSVIYALSFSSDGSLIANGGWDPAKIEVWQVSTGNQVASLSSGLSNVACLKFAPQGAILAAGGYGTNTLEIWNVENATLLHALNTSAQDIVSIAFAPDGKSLAAAGFQFTESAYDEGILEIWNPATGKIMRSVDTNSSGVSFVTYSPNGKELAVTSDPLRAINNTIGIWDTSTFSLTTTLQTSSVGLSGVLAFAPDGKSLATFGELWNGNAQSSYSLMVAWDLATGNEKTVISPSPYSTANSVAFSPDGNSIAVGGLQATSYAGEGWVGIWDANSQKLKTSLNSQAGTAITSVAFSSDGSLLADASDGKWYGSVLEVWNIAHSALVASLPVGARRIHSIAFAPTGDVLAAAGPQSDVQLWNAATGTLVGDFETSATNGVSCLAFSPDGSRLVLCGSMNWQGYQIGVMELWDAASGQRLKSINTGLYSLNSVAFAHDGIRIVDAGLRYIKNQNAVVPAIEIWGSPYDSYPTNVSLSTATNPIGNLALTQDDKTLFAQTNQGIEAFEASTGNTLGTFDVGSISQLALSPKGGQLAYVMNSVLAVAPIPSFSLSGIASISLAAPELQGGMTSLGTVTLTHPAPSSGMTISLSTGNAVAAVIPSITVAAGSTTASFTVTTSGVDGRLPVSIFAQAGNQKVMATLIVDPPKLASVQLLGSSFVGGGYTTAWVNLSGPAGPSGVTVSLKSNNSNASVPATVRLDAGQSTALITINTSPVKSQTMVKITSILGPVSIPVTLTLLPPTVSSLSLNPGVVSGGSSSVGTVWVDAGSLPGGMLILLASDSPDVTVPSSVTVSQGQLYTTFEIKTTPVAKNKVVTLSAKYGTVTKTATLTVERPKLSTLTLNPTSVQGGQPSIGTITIGSPAPAGGLVISLSSNIPAATVPAKITIPAGMTSTTFAVSTTPVPSTTGATIRATSGGASISTVLSIS